MKSTFVGRQRPLEELEARYRDAKSDLVLIYGRRRVGKSRLIHEFTREKKQVFLFTGVEISKSEKQEVKHHQQIEMANFLFTLSQITGKASYKRLFDLSWEEGLHLLDENLPHGDTPCCIVLDEFPWMAGQRLELVRALFKIWELKWSHRKKLMLIVCGSSVGFLDKHFVHSTQFYGRSTLLIHLNPLTFFEAQKFFMPERSFEERLELYMVFGGIPQYLEQIPKRDSVRKTINHLCFTSNSFFADEVPHLLRSSFIRESDKYQKILRALTDHLSLDYEAVAEKAGGAMGSSLKHLLENLLHCDMIERFTPMDRFGRTNLFRFQLSDEFIRFYYLFMEPNIHLIQKNMKDKDLYDIIIPQRLYFSWKGRCFERIVQRHALEIADRIGISLVVKNYGPYFSRDKKCPQMDLVYLRTDKTITVCEIKYSERTILWTSSLKSQIKRQKEFLENRFPGRRIEHYLITNASVSEAIKNSSFFHRVIRFSDLMS